MRLRRILGAIVVALCIGVPIAEGFDRWDDTLQDGNDTEANLVLAAVCVGFALTITATLVARLRALPTDSRVFISFFAPVQTATPLVPPIPATSPPTPLRI